MSHPSLFSAGGSASPASQPPQTGLDVSEDVARESGPNLEPGLGRTLAGRFTRCYYQLVFARWEGCQRERRRVLDPARGVRIWKRSGGLGDDSSIPIEIDRHCDPVAAALGHIDAEMNQHVLVRRDAESLANVRHEISLAFKIKRMRCLLLLLFSERIHTSAQHHA